MQQQREQ